MHNHKVVDWDYPRWQLFALDWNDTLHCFDRFSDRLLLHPGLSGYEEAYTSLPSSSGPMSILGISRHLLSHSHRRPPHAHLLSPPHQYHHQHCRRRRISAQSVPSVCCPNEDNVDEDEDEEDNATSDGQEKFKQSDVYYSFHAAVLKEAEEKPDKGRDGDSNNNNNARVVDVGGKERGRVPNARVTQKGIAEKKMKAFEAVREGQEWR